MVGSTITAAGVFLLKVLGGLWFALHPGSLNLIQAVIERYIWEPLWDPVLLAVLEWPAALVFGLLGTLLLLLGFLRLPGRKKGTANAAQDEPSTGASRS